MKCKKTQAVLRTESKQNKDMKFINGYKATAKQSDKCELLIRIGKLTLVEFKLDFSRKAYRITLLNLTIKN